MSNGFLDLVFAQRKLGGGNKLRSLISIRVPPEGVRRLVQSIEPPFITSIRAIAERNGIEGQPFCAIDEEPAQAVALTANLVSIAYSGYEAEMNLFSFSPMAAHQLKFGAEPCIEPVARVDMNAHMLLTLVEFIYGVKDSLSPEIS